jgi:hypothetical protein
VREGLEPAKGIQPPAIWASLKTTIFA